MLRTYLNQLTPPELADSVENTVNGFMEKLSQTEPKIAQNVLLLGNVQSGKTAQVLGILSALADDGDHFLLLAVTPLRRARGTLACRTGAGGRCAAGACPAIGLVTQRPA